MSALGSRCKDVKLRLWKEYKRDSLSETLLNRPENVPENQWGHFVHMRFTEKWKVQFICYIFIHSSISNTSNIFVCEITENAREEYRKPKEKYHASCMWKKKFFKEKK